MSRRTIRNRKAFQLESLEYRNAPSHVGGLAHVAVAIHHVHEAVQVKHFSDSRSNDKVHPQDKNSGVEQSPDNGVETGSTDPSSTDTNPKDHSSVDPAGQR